MSERKPIPVDGLLMSEVYDLIQADPRDDPMWRVPVRLIEGTLREPFEMPAYDDDGKQHWMMVDRIPAGSTLFGCPVVEKNEDEWWEAAESKRERWILLHPDLYIAALPIQENQ
jgi:hypothetical protein